MTRRILSRLAIAAIVCFAIAWWAGLAERPGTRAPGPSPLPARIFEQTRFPEKTLRALHPNLSDLLVFDPVAHFLRRPSRSRVVRWHEHADGEFTITTNADSFREDGPTPARIDATRVVVIGDSHTDGMVNNFESFSNLLEGLLNVRAGEGSYDVVNAGVPGSGPLEELGQLRRCLELHPQLIVKVLFAGNDFQGALSSVRHFSGGLGPIPRDRRRFIRPIVQIRKRWPQIAQGFHQAYDLRLRPDHFDLAVAVVGQCYATMVRLCRERSVGFLLVVLPSKFEVDADDGHGYVETMLHELEMTPEDCTVNRRLAEAFLETVEQELGVPILDLYELMRSAPSALFWSQDHHLNVRGHELVARALVAPVLELLAGGE